MNGSRACSTRRTVLSATRSASKLQPDWREFLVFRGSGGRAQTFVETTLTPATCEVSVRASHARWRQPGVRGGIASFRRDHGRTMENAERKGRLAKHTDS